MLDENADINEKPIYRTTHLANKSRRMPSLKSNYNISLFLDLIQKDISEVDWTKISTDNLTLEERGIMGIKSSRRYRH